MKRGDIVELVEDMTFYKKGKKAYFIRVAKNPNEAEIVWFGEEKIFNEHGDIEIVPLNIIRLVETKRDEFRHKRGSHISSELPVIQVV